MFRVYVCVKAGTFSAWLQIRPLKKYFSNISIKKSCLSEVQIVFYKWLAVNHFDKSVKETFWREREGKMGWFKNGKWGKLRLRFQSSPGKTNNKTKPPTGRHDAPLSEMRGKTEFNNRKWSHSVKGNPKVGGGAVRACTEINHTDVVVFPAWTCSILRDKDKIRQNIQFFCVSPETHV